MLELLATMLSPGFRTWRGGIDLLHLRTASRGGAAWKLISRKVPKREPGMTPYKFCLSESQERMLIIAKRGKENIVAKFSRNGMCLAPKSDASPTTNDACAHATAAVGRGNSGEAVGGRKRHSIPRCKTAFCCGRNQRSGYDDAAEDRYSRGAPPFTL